MATSVTYAPDFPVDLIGFVGSLVDRWAPAGLPFLHVEFRANGDTPPGPTAYLERTTDSARLVLSDAWLEAVPHNMDRASSIRRMLVASR